MNIPNVTNPPSGGPDSYREGGKKTGKKGDRGPQKKIAVMPLRPLTTKA
jgi:hypothetical protein